MALFSRPAYPSTFAATLDLYVGLELEGILTGLFSYVVLCTIILLHNFMSSLTGPWIWFWSHWAHFTVLRFILYILILCSFVFITV